MNNFGVIEVASAKTTNAPGWAYVPDTPATAVPSQSVSAVHLHVNRNKRAARNTNQAPGSTANAQKGISARHDAKIQKELDELQRDNLGGRDGHIPIPSGGRDKDGKTRGHTPNVRKILASQKTFANHLDDYEAWSRTQAQNEAGPGRSQAQSLEGTPAPSAPPGASRRPPAAAATKKGGLSSSSSRGKAPAGGNKKSATPLPLSTPSADPDTTMTDAPPPTSAAAQPEPTADSKILAPCTRFQPPPCLGDSDPLLESWLPPLPTDEELRELLRAPPLDYNQARGVWAEDDRRYPARQFCEVCGYWGRVRCIKCGTRVCALDCLDVHRDECITRYGL